MARWLKNSMSNSNLTSCCLLISIIGSILLCHHRQRTLLSTYVLLTRQFGMLAVTYFHFISICTQSLSTYFQFGMLAVTYFHFSFVSFRPPSEFCDFPSLRKLDLEFVDTTRRDLEVVLSNCIYLKWLSLVRCFLDDELKLDHPLSQLRHLTVLRCRVTRIELRVLKLDTFQYDGDTVPIVINQDAKLENADICFSKRNFQDTVSALLNAIPRVRNLTLQTFNPLLETQYLLNSTDKFSRLRCLQLLIGITSEDAVKLPNVVSILRAAPFIEKLEIHKNLLNGNGELRYATLTRALKQVGCGISWRFVAGWWAM
ncbi:uncharacterized protein LOC125546872 [Triticum urartu]|uniref:uncharacterized protein LOC125546872 n=1 Tax=Triticum urartu TaxID=4572 RepID=UPI0020448555|nr:uncharacterized protein LOC125546872 [Triticum urartu]